MRIECRTVTCAIVALLLCGRTGYCADLRAIVATPMTGVVNDLRGELERSTGSRLAATFVSGPIVKREIDGGRAFDVAVSITPVVDALIKDGKLRGETRADVGFAVVGVGVRAGAPKPDIGSVAAFRQALLDAHSVAHSATGASGDHFKRILQQLGIAEQMQPKLRPMGADAIAQAVPTGQAEMIVVTASVIIAPGVDFVGPIPAELQFYNTFAAGIGAQAENKAAAQALITLLTSSRTVPVFKAHGMEPGVPK